MRERQCAHEASADLRSFDSVRHAVASLFGGESSSETTDYIQRMKTLSAPHASPSEPTPEDNIAAAMQALSRAGVPRVAN